jgi:hypothetical protein
MGRPNLKCISCVYLIISPVSKTVSSINQHQILLKYSTKMADVGEMNASSYFRCVTDITEQCNKATYFRRVRSRYNKCITLILTCRGHAECDGPYSREVNEVGFRFMFTGVHLRKLVSITNYIPRKIKTTLLANALLPFRTLSP